ncbi:MAG: hypothetical protein R3302_07885 [Sulfurimonadaceae bacterium]|nr:hypothetical protein [Sulfurimonadaceae bacterium]
MKPLLITMSLLSALTIPSSAKSDFFPELSLPLYDYCERIENSMLIKDELGFLFEQCSKAHDDDEKLAQQAIKPAEYLMSLRKLDKAYHKSLWQMHLLLKNAIAQNDAELFKRIIALEERKVFNMNGLLPHALEFMARHDIEVPYYINPNIKKTAFQHDW